MRGPDGCKSVVQIPIRNLYKNSLINRDGSLGKEKDLHA